MKKILLMCLIALGMVFISCNNKQLETTEEIEPKTENYVNPFNRFDEPKDFDGHSFYEVFQTLHEYEGLASCVGDIVYIVNDEPIYDGLRIEETKTKKFKLVGTYTYYTVEDKRKVVPVIMLMDDMGKPKEEPTIENLFM